jgi:uncharacterized protein YqhQ
MYLKSKIIINLHSAKNQTGYMMFEVFMVVKVYTVIFWVVTVCSLVCARFQYHNPEDHNMNYTGCDSFNNIWLMLNA